MKISLIAATVVALGAIAAAQSPEDLYAEGKRAYDRGDYVAAIVKWQASYNLSGESDLLFNLAQARRLSGDCPGAIANYHRFVAEDPSSDQRQLAEDLGRELEAKCGTPIRPISIAAPPKTDTQPTLDAQPGRTLQITGLATGGAGVVLLATGLGLGHHGQSLGDEVTAACTTSCDWSAQKAEDTAGRRDVSIGYALDIVGITAIAGGTVMYYLGVREHSVSLSPRLSGGGAVVSWSGSW
jgi:hypothetical protein